MNGLIYSQSEIDKVRLDNALKTLQEVKNNLAFFKSFLESTEEVLKVATYDAGYAPSGRRVIEALIKSRNNLRRLLGKPHIDYPQLTLWNFEIEWAFDLTKGTYRVFAHNQEHAELLAEAYFKGRSDCRLVRIYSENSV